MAPKEVACVSDSDAVVRARVGFTVSKRVGKAVIRNYVRRRMRSLFEKHAERLDCTCDYVWIAFSRASDAQYSELDGELRWMLGKIHSKTVSKGSLAASKQVLSP